MFLATVLGAVLGWASQSYAARKSEQGEQARFIQDTSRSLYLAQRRAIVAFTALVARDDPRFDASADAVRAHLRAAFDDDELVERCFKVVTDVHDRVVFAYIEVDAPIQTLKEIARRTRVRAGVPDFREDRRAIWDGVAGPKLEEAQREVLEATGLDEVAKGQPTIDDEPDDPKPGGTGKL